jgi:hypothetical protein
MKNRLFRLFENRLLRSIFGPKRNRTMEELS